MAKPVVVYTKSWQSIGSGLFARNLVEGLLLCGKDVLFVCAQADDPAFERARPGLTRLRPAREREKGRKLLRIAASFRRLAGSALGLARARLTTRDFIVSIPDPLIFAMPMLVLLRATGARIVYVVHDPLPHAWRLPRRLRWFENLGYVITYRMAAALVVLSTAGAVTLRQHYAVGHKPIAVIAHGIFVLLDPGPVPGNRRLLVFGTLRRNKGVLEAIAGAIAAADAGVQCVLHIAGAPDPVEPDYWARCEPLARSRPDVIDLEVGFVDSQRLDTIIAESDALVLPYRDFNSQSGVALLAASNARPLITTASGGIAELLEDGIAAVTIAHPAGTEEIAAAIRHFLDVPAEIWNERTRRYRDHISSTMAWHVIARRYVELFEELA